jgi:NAD+ diphosphatase
MSFCRDCGAELTEKLLEKENRMVPFCPECNDFKFPLYNVCCSMIVMNRERDHIALIKQYGVTDYILVAGYVNKGESAENTVVREVKEELGLDVVALKYNRSEYFPKTNTLMLNFGVVVDDMSLDGMNTDEVDVATWLTLEEAQEKIMPGSLARKFLLNHLDKLQKNWGDWKG